MSESSDGTDKGAKTRYDEFTVSGSDLLARVKQLVHEGNVRRVFIKNGEGRTLLEIPLTAGVGVAAVAAVISPILVAVGAVAAMMTDVTVGVERTVTDEQDAKPDPPSAGTLPPAE